MNMNKKGFTVVEIFAVIAVFSVIYLISMVNASYAFSFDYKKEAYEEKINMIEMQSELYASMNEDLFLDTSVIYLYVSDLVDNNLIVTSENGDVTNPLSESSNLNNLKIEVFLINGEFEASVLEL